MAKRNKKQDQAPQLVRCADCRHFERDTAGISRNISTGEYFMGVCRRGETPDTPIKQFADKDKICQTFTRK